MAGKSQHVGLLDALSMTKPGQIELIWYVRAPERVCGATIDIHPPPSVVSASAQPRLPSPGRTPASRLRLRPSVVESRQKTRTASDLQGSFGIVRGHGRDGFRICSLPRTI